MNYHLNQHGKDLGIFPLEELRRRRSAGELTGEELVWCERMSGWERLNAVLQAKLPATAAVPPPLPRPRSNRTANVIAVVVMVAVVVIIAAYSVFVYKTVRRVQTIAKQVTGRSGVKKREYASTIASKPVFWTTNTLTLAQTTQRAKAFRVRQFLEGYRQASEHRPVYDTEALELIQMWVNYHAGAKLQSDREAVVALADKLAANPACDDPLVLTVAGTMAEELHEAVRRLDRALKLYDHSRYKAYPKLDATITLAIKLKDLHDRSDRVVDLDEMAKRLLADAFQDGSILPDDQAEIADILVMGWGNAFFDRNDAAIPAIVKEAGPAFEWLALVLEGEHQINAAWKVRGSGYSKSVKKEGWKGFSEHLDEARADLTKAWELRPDLPLAPCRMIYVALGDAGLEEMRLWFDRTTALQIDYPTAWNHMRWGLRPRWYGDESAMLAFGIMAAQTHRYDTDLPRKLFDSVTDLESEESLPPGEHLYGRADIWPHMQQMYEGYLAEASQAPVRDGWRGSYAIVAYLAGHYDIARQQLEALNWKLTPQKRANWGRDLSLMPLEVAARTGSLARGIQDAELAWRGRDLKNAQRAFFALLSNIQLDERSREFVHDRLTTIATEQQIETGEWTDFMPADNKLTGWTQERGKFTVLPDGTLEVQANAGGHILFSRARMGNDFEIRGTFEVVSSSTHDFQAGLVIGTPQFESSDWYAFRMKRNATEGDVGTVAKGWTKNELRLPATLNADTNTFYVHFNHGEFTVKINDRQFLTGVTPVEIKKFAVNDCHLGFGAFNDTNDTVIRYRNVQVRQLKTKTAHVD